MEKISASFSLAILGTAALFAQSVERDVVAASGESFKTSVAQLDWTLGEFAVEHYSFSGLMVSQGFQQSYFDVTGISTFDQQPDFKVYPNPAGKSVTIELPDEKGDLFVGVFDMKGVLFKEVRFHNPVQKFHLELDDLADGVYLLILDQSDSGNRETFRLIKNTAH